MLFSLLQDCFVEMIEEEESKQERRNKGAKENAELGGYFCRVLLFNYVRVRMSTAMTVSTDDIAH